MEKKLLLIVGILSIAILVVMTEQETTNNYKDEITFKEPYLKVKTTGNDSGVISIINSSNCQFFPQELYYRNGTIAGWLIDGSFSTEFPYDVWFHASWNASVNDNTVFTINSWEELP